MIVSVNVCLEELTRLGRLFKWKKPKCCPKCKFRLWGHGFVARYFSKLKDALFLKRYRCSRCGCVVTLRPAGFWKRYQTSANEIYEALRFRLSKFTWPPGFSRQRGGHWLSKFILNFQMDHSASTDPPMAILAQLHAKGLHFLSS